MLSRLLPQETRAAFMPGPGSGQDIVSVQTNALEGARSGFVQLLKATDLGVVRVEKGERQWNSPVIKGSIVIAGHKTSVSLEDAFRAALKEIAIGRNKTLSDLVAEIDIGRPQGNLSLAIRLFVLDHYRAKTNGHAAESSGQTPLMVMPAAATSVLRPQ
jgi:predicted DNA-binding ribbon-helix-helix protein